MSLCLSLVPVDVKGSVAFWLGCALPNHCVLPRSCAHTSSTSSRDSRVICIASEVAYICLPEQAGTSSRHQHRFQNELAMWCLFDFSDF